MLEVDPVHWKVFSGIPYESQGAIGIAPARWATVFRIDGIPDFLRPPENRRDRSALREVCLAPENSVLFAYA